MNFIDLFTSIQGEGQYMGVPSIFIRTSGCNLRCCFKNSVCDTAYSSFNPESGRFSIDDVKLLIHHNPQINHIVITGGEPLMYNSDEWVQFINEVCEYRTNICPGERNIITFETNGTMPPLPTNNLKKDLYNISILYSISIKLDTSIPIPEFTYLYKVGNETTSIFFTHKQVENLRKIRMKYVDNVPLFLKDDNAKQFKFVYSGKESLDEIISIINKFKIKTDANSKIILMPEGATMDVLNINRKKAAEACIKYGFEYSDRLHILIWNDKRGK